MGGWESFKMALTCYNKEVREVKWSIWRNYCLGNKDVPNGARFTMIMASKSDSMMESINLYRTKVTFAVTQVKVKCLKNSGQQWT
jgi:hypothetical protein